MSRVFFGVLLFLLAFPSVSPASGGGDPLHFVDGIPKQSGLLRSFSTLKQFVRSIPDAFRACQLSLKEKSESLETIRQDAAIRAKMQELFEARLNAPTTQNCLAFTNVPREFEKIMVTDLGVCAGVTFAAWLGNYLAVWDQAGRDFARFGVAERFPEGWTSARLGDAIERWRKSGGKSYNAKDKDAIAAFYAPFVQRLYVAKEVTVIPFFANIEEFSRHPAVKDLMKRMAIEKWKQTNFNFLSLFEMGFSGRSIANRLTKGEVVAFAAKAEEYLESGLAPISFFTLPKNALGPRRIHVTRVKRIVRSSDGDSLAILMVDPNFLPPDNVKVVRISGLKSLDDRDSVRAVYSRYVDQQVDLESGKIIHGLAELEIVPWFEFESMNMLAAWKRFLNRLE